MPVTILPILAAAPTTSAPQQPSFLVQLIPFALIFVVFYFLLIMPARKRQKKHAEMLDQLKAGDRVVTSGGIFATVVGVDEQKIQLRIADGVKIDVAKSAIAGFQDQPQ